MTEEVREHAFEPFFTTKDVGKGTGLGLSSVYGIMKQHNGYINVYSEKGKGTAFKLYLPAIKAEAEQLKVPALPPVVGGTETILFAEDEEAVRRLAKNILEEYGYTVIAAEDGADAIRKYRASERPIDLLVLDVMMPKKTGKAVYDEIKKKKRKIKVLFISGYTADIITKKGVLEPGTSFITKPFSQNVFLRKIREILDG